MTGTGPRRDTGFGAGGSGAAQPGHAEALDRLTRRLSMAGLRLLALRARLEETEDQIALVQASEDLDEAIAEMRRLALASRLTLEGR